MSEFECVFAEIATRSHNQYIDSRRKPGPGEKRCAGHCYPNIKPIQRFSKNKSKPDGLQPYCRDCRKIRYTRDYRARTKEKTCVH